MGAKVLVSDDDVALRTLITRLLQRHDHFEVESARDGVEAIEKLDHDGYDAVLLDLMMPRVDGFGVLDYLREHHPDILKRVIVMTASSDEQVARVDRSAVCGVVRKPFDIHEFIHYVKNCVESLPKDWREEWRLEGKEAKG